MKRLVAIALLLMSCSAFAKEKYKYVPNATVTPEIVQRAAASVATLRSMMRDPDSFVLESVYLRESTDKYDKHANEKPAAFCYFFRSHNAMGGYGDTGEALLDEKGKLRVWSLEEQRHLFYETMACTPKRRLADITAEVKAALNPPMPTQAPEDKAKQAQKYADCLKLAVDNPSIICKP
jgi:hypothetical protein